MCVGNNNFVETEFRCKTLSEISDKILRKTSKYFIDRDDHGDQYEQ